MTRFILTHKSQVFGFDLMMATILFLVGITAIYVYAINFPEAGETLDSLFYEGNLISSLILSEGLPSNWSLADVEIPGILSNKKINQTKLDAFYNTSYADLKKLLGTKNEFYFNFTGMEITGLGLIAGIGNYNGNPENLIRIERFTIYKNKPVKFTLLIWN